MLLLTGMISVEVEELTGMLMESAIAKVLGLGQYQPIHKP